MAVAVQAQVFHITGTVKTAPHPVQRKRCHAAIDFEQFMRDEFMRQQEFDGFHTEALDVQCGAMLIRHKCTHRVDAPDETPHPFQRVAIIQFRCTSAVFAEHRETEILESMQRVSADIQRRHHRDFALNQRRDKGVFFQNGCIRPAPGAIELGNQWRPIFHACLVDAVLVTVQCQQPPVAAQADAIQRIQH